MKIFTKWGEVKQEINLSCVGLQRIKELIDTKQYSVKLSVCRDLPKDSRFRQSGEAYGFHRIVLTQNMGGNMLVLKFCSTRLTAQEMVKAGFEPIPKAIEKEKRRALLGKLSQSE